MQAFGEARDVGAAPAIGRGRAAEEAHPQVAVAQILNDVFAAEDGSR